LSGNLNTAGQIAGTGTMGQGNAITGGISDIIKMLLSSQQANQAQNNFDTIMRRYQPSGGEAMPQYADPSVLMAGKGISIPDPLELAGKGQTLQGLFLGNASKGLELQQQMSMIDALQNPAVANAIFNPSGGGTMQLSPELTQQYGP